MHCPYDIGVTLMLFPRTSDWHRCSRRGPRRVTERGQREWCGDWDPGDDRKPPSLTSLAAGELAILLMGLGMRCG